MTIKKVGTPKKIKETADSKEAFDKMTKKIAKENNLVRCNKCGKLVCKLNKEGNIINIKKSNLEAIAEVKSASVKCPKCGHVTGVK